MEIVLTSPACSSLTEQLLKCLNRYHAKRHDLAAFLISWLKLAILLVVNDVTEPTVLCRICVTNN